MYVTVHTKRYLKLAPNFLITPDFVFIDLSTSLLQIWGIAHFVAEIQLLFHPEQRKLRSPKWQFSMQAISLYMRPLHVACILTHACMAFFCSYCVMSDKARR